MVQLVGAERRPVLHRWPRVLPVRRQQSAELLQEAAEGLAERGPAYVAGKGGTSRANHQDGCLLAGGERAEP